MKRGCGCLVAGVMFFASLAFLAGGIGWGAHSYDVGNNWIPVDGTVVDLVRVSSGDSDTFAPIVEYVSSEGVPRRFQHSVSSGGLLTPDIGDPVDVLYDPDDPAHAIVRSDSGLWLGPALIGGFGVLGLLVTVLATAGVRRANRRSGAATVPVLSGPRRPAEFRRVESNIDDTGTFRYRMIARGEDGKDYLGEWLSEDPTMDLMASGYRVALVQQGDHWVVFRA